MGLLSYLLFPWGLIGIILEGLAIVHFIRRRPDTYWIFVILFLGPLGAINLSRSRGAARHWIAGPVVQSFSAAQAHCANWKRRFATIRRRETTKSSATFTWMTASFNGREPRSTKPLPRAPIRPIRFTGAEFAPFTWATPRRALPDLERVVAKEPDYDFSRAAALLAHAYAQTGQKEKAEKLFRQVTVTSTLSETYLNFAESAGLRGPQC